MSTLKVNGRPLSAKQTDVSTREAEMILLQNLSGLKLRSYPNIHNDGSVDTSNYQQHNERRSNKISSVTIQKPFHDTGSITKLTKTSKETKPINYEDKEAIELASEIVNNLFTMRQAGEGPSNPIMDKYLSNGKSWLVVIYTTIKILNITL